MRWTKRILGLSVVLSSVQACSQTESAQAVAETSRAILTQDTSSVDVRDDSIRTRAASLVSARTVSRTNSSFDTATFAGGCFWSMERPFQHVPGVIGTTVGYAGGHTRNPTYEEVNTRTTGHAETVQVEFDPAKVTYEKLLDVFWHNIDPVTKDRQFCDGGSDYRTVVFTRSAAQRSAATASKTALDRSGHFKTPIVTEIVAGARFWRAEDYHQRFADRNPDRYEAYRRGCGRDERLRELWGDAAAPYVPAHRGAISH
ncbi:MAG: peptide-methionine (S)-S-oxide reductase MsrA [Gemmatimonadales bacterium]